jgi:SAM-dependent methyltransferase
MDMPFYRNQVYPHLVSKLGDPPPIREIRKKIISLAQGEVLEVGVGPGVNFLHYNPEAVSKIYALEPNAGMLRLAERQKSRTKLDIEFLDLPGERIPLEEGSIDTVVSTFTFCTIPDLAQALVGIRRVLRSCGKLIFFEHGLSPDPNVSRWQARCEPISRFIFEGCHLTREIPCLLTRAGFTIEHVDAGYLARFPKAWTYCWWGTAIPQSRDMISM